MKKGKVNLMNLHISNIEMSNILLDTAETFITNLLDNLDEVTKYSFAVELIARLDNLSQECYDSADEASQTIIDYLEDTGWNYDELPGYHDYSYMMKKYLYSPDCKLKTVYINKDLDDENLEDEDLKGTDVTDEFNIDKAVSKGLGVSPSDWVTMQGQLHFPNNYANEEALAKGEVKPAPVNSPAEDRKKARAAYLAAMKQQNTSQPT